jgi:hypothetical protein
MSDEELDVIITERFKAYETGTHLPDEFKKRFVGSVRRKRMLWRAGALCLACVAAAVCIALSCAMRSDTVRSDASSALMANTAVPTNETSEVSCLMFLSFLRECFSRSKSSRRKEEE